MDIHALVLRWVTLHEQSIMTGKEDFINSNSDPFLPWVLDNHLFNYQLWLAEDRARREDMGFEFVYRAKREIDECNQKRNDCVEKMDELFVERFKPSLDAASLLHSETPGMMIDRLSILALKIHHMNLQAHRTDVDAAHRMRCSEKTAVLKIQKQDLADALVLLIQDVVQGKRTFKLYRQFKMYNDRNLNPQLYALID